VSYVWHHNNQYKHLICVFEMVKKGKKTDNVPIDNGGAQRRIQSNGRYLLAFIIGTLVFILGFVITYSVSYFQYDRISDFQDITSYSIFSDKLGYEIFNKDICSFNNFKEISEGLGYQGRVIDDLERRLGKDNKDVLFRKRFYTLVELEHLEFINKMNKECKRSIPTILFFYSNEENDLSTSEDAGKLLDTLSSRHRELIIYSFDVNLDSELIDNLKDEYEVYKTPFAVVNQESKIIDFTDIKKFEDVLGESDAPVSKNVIRL